MVVTILATREAGRSSTSCPPAAAARFHSRTSVLSPEESQKLTWDSSNAVAGPHHPVAALDPEHYAAVMDRWSSASAATWNRHPSALVSGPRGG
ncbi:hypothetical protein ACQP1W_30520 [Spirillospora sp. CA-255316]